jgi:hypothetical protein
MRCHKWQDGRHNRRSSDTKADRRRNRVRGAGPGGQRTPRGAREKPPGDVTQRTPIHQIRRPAAPQEPGRDPVRSVPRTGRPTTSTRQTSDTSPLRAASPAGRSGTRSGQIGKVQPVRCGSPAPLKLQVFEHNRAGRDNRHPPRCDAANASGARGPWASEQQDQAAVSTTEAVRPGCVPVQLRPGSLTVHTGRRGQGGRYAYHPVHRAPSPREVRSRR